MSGPALDPPPRVKPRLIAAPKIRQLYWCDFPLDAHLPEFWKTRPVLVLSYRNHLSGCVTVLPCTSLDQTGNPWAVPLTTTMDDRPSWVVCDKIASVAVSRLASAPGKIPRLSADEFRPVLQRLQDWLPKLS